MQTGRPNGTPAASAAVAAAPTSTFSAPALSPSLGRPYSAGPSPFLFGAALELADGSGMEEAYDPTERFPMPLGFGSEFQFLSELGRRDGPSGQEDFLVQFALGSM